MALLLYKTVRAYKNKIRNQRNLAKIKVRREWFEYGDGEKNSSENSDNNNNSNNINPCDDQVTISCKVSLSYRIVPGPVPDLVLTYYDTQVAWP